MSISALFSSLGRACVRRPRIVIASWALILALGIVYAPRLQQVFEREFVQGNAGEAQRAADVVADEFSDRGAFQQLLVFTSDSRTVDAGGFRDAAAATIRAVEATGLTTSVESYFDSGDERLVSADRRTTYALLNLRSTTHADGMAAAGKLIDRVAELDQPAWMKAFVTGEEALHADLTTQSQESLTRAEAIGLPVALVLLVLVFGALVASVLPLTIGVLSIIVALALAFAVGQFMNLSVFLETFATMIGLGVGIDYSLFMLTRYRAERRAGSEVDEAVVVTVSHAGRAVAFSALAVVIGLSALLATGEPTVISIGIGGVLAVFVAMLAALTLLPAVVTLLGDRIEAPRRLSGIVTRLHRRGVWGRWAGAMMRHPARYGALGVLVLVGLAWPTLQLKTSPLGAQGIGESAQSRQGYELIASEFGPGVTSPVQIVVRSAAGIDQPHVVAGVDRLTRSLAGDDRFAGAFSMTSLVPDATVDDYQALYADGFTNTPVELKASLGAMVNLESGADTTVILAYLPEGPGSDSSTAAIRALRDVIIPGVPELAGETVLVGGTIALQMDMTDALFARFPVVVALILAATFVLLLVLFRSILIPIKAVIMNLLSVVAAYGALVLVFQIGIGDWLLGFHALGAINWITPVLLFAILFGLSMDYEVFLMSRMREFHDRGATNEECVTGGIEQTGGVITGAAAIMVVVFSAFMLSPIVLVKELGFALAVAILIDATVVRMVVVPATMKLLGDWNWWVPPVLDRVLPQVELEGRAPPRGQQGGRHAARA